MFTKQLHLSLFLLVVVATSLSCGDPTDKVEDCTAGEYFDQVRKLCFTCPALREPVCAPGCGFVIESNEDDGCPQARCIESDVCDLCGSTSFFSQTTLQCEPCIAVDGCDDDDDVTPVISGDSCTLRCD